MSLLSKCLTTLLWAACTLLAITNSSRATEIWIGAEEPEWRRVHHWADNDYLELFKTDAAWPIAASHTSVFHLSKRFVLESSDEELRLVLAGLNQRHIKIAVQGTPLLAGTTCGLGIEGHGPANDMLAIAKRIQGFGASIDYVVMDEPLWFGHQWNGNKNPKIIPCHSSISEIAQQTATKMKALRQIFPNAKIGDIEPMGVPAYLTETWKKDLSEWMDTYRMAMNEPLAFFQLDVVWLSPTWQSIVGSVVASAKERGISLGVVYNGTPADNSDEAWVASAETHFKYVEKTMGLQPSQAFFFSWMEHPREMLPESKPGTLTNLVLRYVNWRAQKH